MKIVRFQSPEMAKRVQAHLYGVTLNGNELRISELDEEAFNCVLGLEGLDRHDCFFVTAQSQDFLWLEMNITGLTKPTFSGAILGGINPVNRQCFKLLICNTSEHPQDVVEIPLVIDLQLFYFADLIGAGRSKTANFFFGMNPVTRVFCVIDLLHDPTSYVLKIERNGETELCPFSPSKLSIIFCDLNSCGRSANLAARIN